MTILQVIISRVKEVINNEKRQKKAEKRPFLRHLNGGKGLAIGSCAY